LSPKEFFGNVFFHPCPYGLLAQPWWIEQKGKELIAAHGHQVMTVHEYPPFYNGIGARRLARATNVPAVYEIHHLIGEPQPASLTEWIGRWMSRLWLKADLKPAANVRTVNGTVRDTLVRWGVEENRIAVVPSFYLDRDVLKPDATVTKQYDVVFCGRLAANKGLIEVIHAVASLPGVTLLVIGDGEVRVSAETLVQSFGVANRVTFCGWLPTPGDVMKSIQSAKMLVMHSKSEGGPRVALEAMALGMPVIATKVGVMPDVIQDGVNGVLTCGSVAELAGHIKTLLADDSLRSRMGAEAAKIIERFEKKKLVKDYADFLKSNAR
jgi:glycosyltransferase involved in cell wall biosynthesis